MKNYQISTLFDGIDVISKSNVVCGIDFYGNKLLNFSASNYHTGAIANCNEIMYCLICNKLDFVVIAMESTSFYSIHIANFLSSHQDLLFFNHYVYCLNPKSIANYRKLFVAMDKTDPLDAFVIADFARVGRISSKPWQGFQHLALQRLSRHILHLIESMTLFQIFI